VTHGESPSFGDLLRRYRKLAELTQEELAERAHLSVRGISDLERGARHAPRADTLALLLEALGLLGPGRAEFEAAARPFDEHVAFTTPAPRRPQRTMSADLSLVGRIQEWAALERHLTGGGPPVFFLAGEPGIGKTRLLEEAAGYAPRVGLNVLAGSCHRHGDLTPYAPLLEALQVYLAGQSAARLRTDLRGCSWLVRLLPELASGPIEPVPQWLLPPEQERRLMGQAVERFLTNVAGPAGTLLVLDDLQWAGSDALAMINMLVRSVGGGRLRIVGAYRETEVHADDEFGVMLADLAQAGLATQRRLGPLKPEEATDLLGRLLADDQHAALQVDGETWERLVSRSDGVPFFLVSCAQALHDGALEAGVPWSVAQGVRQRVAALPVLAQEALRVACGVGRSIPRSLLSRMIAQPEQDLVLALEAACKSGLLAERGEREYEITHDVVREVVEADMGAARRTTLHRQIAVALAESPGEPPVEAIAYHFAQTDEHTEAAQWLEQAGDLALARFATGTAIDQYRVARQRALAGAVGATTLSRLDEKLGDLYVWTGEYATAREAYASALTHAHVGSSASDRDMAGRRADLLRREGDTWEKQGEYERALAAFDGAESEGNRDENGAGLPEHVQAAIELSRGAVYQRQGNNEAAAAVAARAVALLSSESRSGPAGVALARAFNLQGAVALNFGDLVQAEALYRRSLDIRERIGDQRGSAGSWNNLGRVAFRRSDLARAEECFQRALDVQERIGDQQACAGCWHNLGAVARDRGDLSRAEECYRHCLAISERIGELQLTEHAWHSLGIVARDRGDLIRAEDCFERCLTIADRIGDLHTHAHTWHQLGIVAWDRGNLGHAETYVERGLAVFERLGDGHGRADCWTTLGCVAGERGNLTVSAWRCRAARRLARRLEINETAARATLGQGFARLRAGRLRAAATWLGQAHVIATTCDLRLETIQIVLARTQLQLAGIPVGHGSLTAAEELVREGLLLATQGGYRREEALAHRLVARCWLLRHDFVEAETHLQAALAIQTEMGAVLEAARTRLVLAETLHGSEGAGYTAKEALRLIAQARESFLATGAQWDLSDSKNIVTAWEATTRAHNAG
jgi:tetratricopeptide (TPR) repeat protein/transcriptional regulator with XRE-family HTH domain